MPDRTKSAGAGLNVGRNDPCACGSGKKYKRCCLAAPGDLMEQAARTVRRVQDDVEPRVVRFLHSLCGTDAMERAWEKFACGHDDLDPDGPESQLFLPWLLYNWIPETPGRAAGSDTRPVARVSSTCPATNVSCARCWPGHRDST